MRMGLHRFLMVVIVVLCTGAASGQTAQEIARLGLSSTVTLVAYDEVGRAYGSGSGFTVAPGLVLTNYHVIEGARFVLAHEVGDSAPLWIDEIVMQDPRRDLALLATRQVSGPALELRTGDRPEIGEVVYAVGSPLGLEGTFTQGIVSSYRDVAGVPLMQITAPISPGSSGGPVLDASGRVVGVVVATIIEGQNLNFAIPAVFVQGFLARLDTPPTTTPNGVTQSEASDAARPSPSFDCDLATAWSELAICSSRNLAQLDLLLNAVYGRVREKLTDAAFEVVRQDQRSWLEGRESCETQPAQHQEDCLAEYIRHRIAVLESYD